MKNSMQLSQQAIMDIRLGTISAQEKDISLTIRIFKLTLN